MSQTNDNPENPRLWLDVARDLLGAFVYNSKVREEMEESKLVKRAIRTFYSFSTIAQYALFGQDLTDKIYELNGRLSF
ncbi:MAG: hypothetical protein NT076_03950 [Candidatus Pacearchaeota archaeon]|nr:hypothetical protein [Candidatus Pacearchaeota archaeon]